MTDNEQTQDLPEIVAAVIAMVPPLVLRTGWAYLKMRKRAQKVSKQLERQFIEGGIPSEYAGRLAEQFESDMSLTKMIRRMDRPFGGAWRQQPLEK